MIKDVIKVDEGDYTCIARNKAGEMSQEVSLNVFGKGKKKKKSVEKGKNLDTYTHPPPFFHVTFKHHLLCLFFF